MFICGSSILTAAELKWNFEENANEPKWVSVNDTVMGGRSKGGPEVKEGFLHFSGTLSLENNGGFSSIRTRDFSGDLSDSEGLVLRVLGDGRTYQLRVSTDATYRRSRIAYRADFETKKGEWTEVKVPFSSMKPGWRGMKLKGPELDLTKVTEIGILLGDKKPGEFALKVDWVKSY